MRRHSDPARRHGLAAGDVDYWIDALGPDLVAVERWLAHGPWALSIEATGSVSLSERTDAIGGTVVTSMISDASLA